MSLLAARQLPGQRVNAQRVHLARLAYRQIPCRVSAHADDQIIAPELARVGPEFVADVIRNKIAAKMLVLDVREPDVS